MTLTWLSQLSRQLETGTEPSRPTVRIVKTDQIPGRRDLIYATLQRDDSVFTAYLKVSSGRGLLCEVLCNRLAISAGLPVVPVFPINHAGRWCVAAVDSQYGDLLSLVQSGNQSVSDLLVNWQYLARAAVFDELIFNEDRNKGNLLWDGAHGFYLNDHASTFKTTSGKNHLINILIASQPGAMDVLATTAETLQSEMSQSIIDRVFDGINIPTATTENIKTNLRESLLLRAAGLTVLVEKRAEEAANYVRKKVRIHS